MSSAAFDKRYTQAARSLADHLWKYARDRREEEKKAIAAAHTELARIRREEVEEQKNGNSKA